MVYALRKQFVVADLSDPNARVHKALHEAVRYQRFRPVEALLLIGADPNYLKNGLESTVHLAVTVGRADILRMLVEHGAKVDQFRTTRPWTTPLQGAVKGGLVEIVRILVNAGADVNQINGHKRAILAEAVEAVLSATQIHVGTSIIEILIDGGADVNGGGEGQKALCLAETRNNRKAPEKIVVEFLKHRGASV